MGKGKTSGPMDLPTTHTVCLWFWVVGRLSGWARPLHYYLGQLPPCHVKKPFQQASVDSLIRLLSSTNGWFIYWTNLPSTQDMTAFQLAWWHLGYHWFGTTGGVQAVGRERPFYLTYVCPATTHHHAHTHTAGVRRVTARRAWDITAILNRRGNSLERCRHSSTKRYNVPNIA